MSQSAAQAGPIEVFPLAEYLGDEMQARGWTIEDAGGRMGVQGPARDTLTLALAMAVQKDNLLLTDEFMDGLARAFDVSPQFFRNLHRTWLNHPEARQPYSAPDSLFGPWLREALTPLASKPADPA